MLCSSANRCIFRNQWNSIQEDNNRLIGKAGRLLQRCSPAMVKDWLPRLVPARGSLHVAMLDNWIHQQLVIAVSWQSSARYCRDRQSGLVKQNCQLKFNTLSHWLPVKLLQDWHDVLVLHSIIYNRHWTELNLALSPGDLTSFRTSCHFPVFTVVKIIPLMTEAQGYEKYAPECYSAVLNWKSNHSQHHNNRFV